MATKTPYKTSHLPSHDGGMAALHANAEQIRSEKKRDKDGAYLARWPGLLRPNLATYDRSALRTRILKNLDSQSDILKMDTWYPVPRMATILGYKDAAALVHDMECQSWLGFTLKRTETEKMSIRIRGTDEKERNLPSFLIHTPDGGRVFRFILIATPATK